MSAADDAYELARRLIAEASAGGARSLNLSSDAGTRDLTSLPPEIARLSGLLTLDLGGTDVEDISSISSLKSLTTLRLGGTKVTDLSPISDLERLGWLRLEDTKVADLSALSGLTTLIAVWLDGTNVTDIAPLIGSKGLHRLDLNSSAIVDLRPLRAMDVLAEQPRAGGLSFRDSEATLVDPQIARIAEIEDDGERAKALFAYLEDWVPPGERPEVGGDEAAAVSEAGARLEVATSHPSEAEREERLKLVLHERLKEKSAALAVAAGNRFFRLAARSRALEDQLDREFGELDLLMLHLAIEDLRDLDRLGREDEDGEAFPPEVVVPLGDVLRLGPGLTLGHKEVDLLVERANRRRAGPPVPAGEVAAQDAMSVAVSLDADTIGPRLRKLEERVADSETAEAKELQKAANRNVLWKLAAWGGSLGTGVAASVIAATYGVEITAFVQTNWAVLVEAAGTYGPQFARWFVLSMQQVSEFAGLAANVPVPPRAGSRDREE